MKTLIIGVNFFGHDTGAFYVAGGHVYAVSEERFTRIKHDALFPIQSINWILSQVEVSNFDEILFAAPTTESEKFQIPENFYDIVLSKRKLIEKSLQRRIYVKDLDKDVESESISQFGKLFSRVKNRFFRSRVDLKKAFIYAVNKHCNIDQKNIRVEFFDHHLCHAMGAKTFSSYSDAAVITFDGWGDGYFSKIYHMRKGELLYKFGSRTSAYSNIQKYSFIRDAKKSVLSVGHIYSIFTFLLGFTPGSDEGKVEALAAFSEKDETLKLYYDLVSATEIQNCSISFTDNINEIFDDMYIDRLLVENNKVSIAYSVQKYLEFVMLRLVQQVVTMLKTDRIVLCGGVCANVIMNKKIFDNIVRDIYIFPAMGDDGLAAGAWAACADKNNFEYNIVDYDMPYYGPSYSAKDTVNVLNQYKGKVQYQELGNDFDKKIAELVSLKKIGALFMGRMEYGPRSLGNRSIIADVRDKGIHKKMNLQIKKRPEFQPFCPSILDEERSKLFKESYLNKHMTCAFDLKEEYYETLPGICHVDGTARVQFVTEKTNEKLYRILKEVKKITGYGALINTSFNKHGRTIVNTPEDAIIDFIDTDLDFLFMNGFLIKRN